MTDLQLLPHLVLLKVEHSWESTIMDECIMDEWSQCSAPLSHTSFLIGFQVICAVHIYVCICSTLLDENFLNEI